MTELKPCPFHKEKTMPYLETGYDEGNGHPESGGYWAAIECPVCDVEMATCEQSTEELAVKAVTEAWNTRFYDIDDIGEWAFYSMEGCDEPEFSLFSSIHEGAVRYKKGETLSDTRYKSTCKWTPNYQIDEGGCTYDTDCAATVIWEGSLPPKCMFCGGKVIGGSDD